MLGQKGCTSQINANWKGKLLPRFWLFLALFPLLFPSCCVTQAQTQLEINTLASLLFIWLGWDEDLFTWPGPSLALFTPALWSGKLNCKLQSWHFGPRPWRFHLYDRPSNQATNQLADPTRPPAETLLIEIACSSSRSPFGFWIYILCRVLTFENALNSNLY